MTTYAFTPVNTASPPWQSQFTLDGSSYKVTAYWNIYGQRWYIKITDSSGNLAWSGPIIGSPDNYDIYLAPGVFSTSTILYRVGTGNFEVKP